MIRIDFIDNELLYSDTPTVTFTVYPLQYDITANNTSDIFFDEYTPQQVNVVLDFGDILNYFETRLDDPLYDYSRYKLFKYGCKIYDNNTLIFTGMIPVESIKVNYNQYTIRLSILSVLAAIMLTEREFDLKSLSTIGEDGTVNAADLVNEIFVIYLMLYGLAFGYTNRPQLIQSDGTPININEPAEYGWSDYLNDYPNWSSLISWSGSGISTISEYDMVKIGFFENESNQLTPHLFMLRAWYGTVLAGHTTKYTLNYRWKKAELDLNNPLQIVKYDGKTEMGIYQFSDWDWQETIEDDFPQMINFIASHNGETFSHSTYNITYVETNQSGVFQFSGQPPIISKIKINMAYYQNDDPQKMKLLGIINDISILKQCVLTSDPQGNIIQTSRPVVNSSGTYTEINTNLIIEHTLDSIILRGDVSNKFDWIDSSIVYKNLLIKNYEAIMKKYKRKLNLMLDGIDNQIALADGIRLYSKNYIVTSVKVNYEQYTTEIEAYGEV